MCAAPLRLGVNIDHVATIRNARGGRHPDPVRAAKLAIVAGADGITAHLREDRRHIRDDDIARLKPGAVVCGFHHLAVASAEDVARLVELEATLVGYEVIADAHGDLDLGFEARELLIEITQAECFAPIYVKLCDAEPH